MKKIIFTSISIFCLHFGSLQAQSVSITPTGDEILITKYNSGIPNLAGRQSSGTAAAPTASSNGLGLVEFGGRGHTGSNFTANRSSILMTANETWTSTANGTRMTFFTTANGSTSNTERMRIDNNGNIGIGTNVPEKKLHVSLNNSGVTPNSNANSFFESNGDNYIQVGSPEANENGILFGKPSAGASGGIIYTPANAMNLRTGGNNTRMTITSAGNVGIGTTAPTAKLDIEGDIVVKKSTVTVAGTYNALNRSSASSIYFNTSGTINLNGIDAGVDGLILYIFCGSSTTLVIGNENVGAAISNRIATHTGANVTISGRGGATLIYESTSARWRVVGVAL